MALRDDPEKPDFADLTRRAFRLCLALLGDEAEANDATQEALTRAWSKKKQKQPDVSWSTWSGGFAVRVCREQRRGRWRAKTLPEDGAEPANATCGHDVDNRGPALRKAISRLPDRQREVVVLRFIVGQSTRQAAQMLGCPEGTIKSNLHKALSNLHATLRSDRVIDEL